MNEEFLCLIAGVPTLLNFTILPVVMHCQISIFEVKMMVKIGVIFMPFANPPSLIPALRNIGILHHKKAKLPKHLQHSVCLRYKIKVTLLPSTYFYV